MSRSEKGPTPPGPRDDGEALALMEPMLVSATHPARAAMDDRVYELVARANQLAGTLPRGIVNAIGTLVRSMNCYYSNLIEGHDTHPVDIERALKADFSSDPKKRDLQLEAVAHIAVQGWLDSTDDAAALPLVELAREIHRAFYARLPDALHWVSYPEATGAARREQVVPGEFRTTDVRVGRHEPISPGAIPRFMSRWQEAYPRTRPAAILPAIGALHHRFSWIHPFLDGNGRTGRLLSHVMLREAGIGNPLWAVSRGLARRVDEYRRLLQAADEPRRGDLDGRGSRSEQALADFSIFFLDCCLDQIRFMEGLIEPRRLQERILLHVRELVALGELDRRAELVMRAALQAGEVDRGEITDILTEERRTANRVVKTLLDRNLLVADTHRAPLRINFSVTNAERWLPGLFPG